jgi:hypothetical protein
MASPDSLFQTLAESLAEFERFVPTLVSAVRTFPGGFTRFFKELTFLVVSILGLCARILWARSHLSSSQRSQDRVP